MIGASLYIIGCTARNRARRWAARLREPRYFFGAAVGAAYLIFTLYLRAGGLLGGRRRGGIQRGGPDALLGILAAVAPTAAGLVMLALAAVAWMVPLESALLKFSKAEVQFLFPAPVTRRQLVIHRLIRSQFGLLFASIVTSLVLGGTSGLWRVRFAVATWVVLGAARVYFAGVDLARARLLGGWRTERLARVPLVLIVAAVALVARTLIRAFAVPGAGFDRIVRIIGAVGENPASGAALSPFVALVAPIVASDWTDYLLALPGALVVLAAVVAWVVFSDRAFHDAATEAADRTRSVRPGTGYRARHVGWSLASRGRPETALAWKAAMQSARGVDRRVLARASVPLVWMGIALAFASRAQGIAAAVSLVAAGAAAFVVFVAPLIFRLDLRQDLQHLALLKTWPIGSAALVRGEMLWPVTALTVTSWSLIAIAGTFSAAVFRAAPVWRASSCAAALLVAPALIAAHYAIHNAAALVFPAWVPLGLHRPRGLDAVGQRLIILGGTLLGLTVASLPGAVLGGVVWLAFSPLSRALALVPAAAVFSVATGIEVLVAAEALGRAYDRLDTTSVEQAE